MTARSSVTLSYDGTGTDEARAPEHHDALRDALSGCACLVGVADARSARRMAMAALERALAKLKKIDLQGTPVAWPEEEEGS